MRITIPRAVRVPKVVDVVTVTVVALVTTLDAWYNVEDTRHADAITYALVFLSIAALLVRRAWPLPVAVICMAALTALYALGHYGELLNLPSVVALCTVAVQGNRRRSIIVGAFALAWSGVLARIGQDVWPEYITDAGSPTLAQVLMPAAALLLGESVRSNRELLDVHAARAAQAEADREREAARRVEEERLRIAREMHDILAHTVSGINVQAGVAVEAIEARPDVAREAMRQVRALGLDALQELRATVAVLRDGEAPESPHPTPHLDQLDDLLERTRRAGTDATLVRDTGTRKLSAPVELATYRIVQEALTNVVRHADAANVAVSVTCENDALIIEVTDDGSIRDQCLSQDASAPRPGFGLVGMAERAAAVGGEVGHGPMPGGGFRVRAVLPLDGVPS